MNGNIFNLVNVDVFNAHGLLRLMHLFSANFPMGNCNYSHGLELAVEYGWISSISDFFIWQKELMNGQFIYLDLPMMQRFYVCLKSKNKERFLYYLQELLSFRETYELRMEEQDCGEMIVKLIPKLGLFLNKDWRLILQKSMLACIAWIGYMWEIPIKMLCLGYSYSSLENNVISGLKLVPFGQFAAQNLLTCLSELLPVIFERSCLVTDNELGSSYPLQGIASSCHEVQDSRLFRS